MHAPLAKQRIAAQSLPTVRVPGAIAASESGASMTRQRQPGSSRHGYAAIAPPPPQTDQEQTIHSHRARPYFCRRRWRTSGERGAAATPAPDFSSGGRTTAAADAKGRIDE